MEKLKKVSEATDYVFETDKAQNLGNVEASVEIEKAPSQIYESEDSGGKHNNIKLRLVELFEKCDKDRNGVIDRMEFKDVMSNVMPQVDDDAKIMELFDTFDIYKKGAIDYRELLDQDVFQEFIEKVTGERMKSKKDDAIAKDEKDLMLESQAETIQRLETYVNETAKPNESELVMLREEKQLLLDQNQNLKQEIARLERDSLQVQQQLQQENEALTIENEELKKEVATLNTLNPLSSPRTQRLVSKEETYNESTYESEVTSPLGSIKRSGQQMMKAANEVEELTKQVAEYDKALSEAHQKHRDLETQIEELHTENLEKDKINQQLTQELGRTRMHLAKKLQSTDRLKIELEELEKEFNDGQQDLQPPAYMRNKTVKFRRFSKDLQKHLTVEKGEWQNLVDSIGNTSANLSVTEWELEYDDEDGAEHAKETGATAEEAEAEKQKNREQMRQEINTEWKEKWEVREQEWQRKREDMQKEGDDQRSIALANMQKEFEKEIIQLKDAHNLQLQQLQDDNRRLQSQLADSKQKNLDKTKSKSETGGNMLYEPLISQKDDESSTGCTIFGFKLC